MDFDVKVVLSSTWQTSVNHMNYLSEFYVDWDDVAPQTRLSGTRLQSITDYIKDKGTTDYYLVLDDMVSYVDLPLHYDGSNLKLVVTDFDDGFTVNKYHEAMSYLKEFLND